MAEKEEERSENSFQRRRAYTNIQKVQESEGGEEGGGRLLGTENPGWEKEMETEDGPTESRDSQDPDHTTAEASVTVLSELWPPDHCGGWPGLCRVDLNMDDRF